MRPEHIRQKAKEAAVRQTVEVKDRVLDSPLMLGIIGGLVTSGVARLLKGSNGRHFREGMSELSEGGSGLKERAAGISEEVKERASALSSAVSEKASELKERAAETVDSVKERIPSGEKLRRGARDANERVRRYVSEEPLVGAVAAIAAGVAAGLLIPMSTRERQIVEPYRERATETLHEVGERISEKIEKEVGDLEERISGNEEKEQPRSSLH
jgi:ElaB/YqjD/DUF883 family membrane-anchored ribosome-binding protein